jgi:hypothetical protein
MRARPLLNAPAGCSRFYSGVKYDYTINNKSTKQSFVVVQNVIIDCTIDLFLHSRSQVALHRSVLGRNSNGKKNVAA